MALPTKAPGRDFKAEIEKYRKALEKDPDSRLFAALADALRQDGQLEEALAVAEKGVKKYPTYISGIVVLAQAYYDAEKYEQAEELFQKVVRMNPENLLAHRYLAKVYDKLGDHARALKAYRAILVLSPGDKEAQQRVELLEATAPPEDAPPPEPPPETTEKPESPREPEEKKDEHKSQIPEQDHTPSGPQQEIQHPPETPSPGIKEPAPPEPEKEELPGPQETVSQEEEDKTQEISYPLAEDGKRVRKPLSEEEMLDLFFQGEDLEKIGIAARAADFKVKPIQEIAKEEPPEEPEAEKPEEKSSAFEITTSALGRVFWKQGFYEKAVSVMAEELKEHPERQALRNELVKALQIAGLDPAPYKTLLESAGSAVTEPPREEKELGPEAEKKSDGERRDEQPLPGPREMEGKPSMPGPEPYESSEAVEKKTQEEAEPLAEESASSPEETTSRPSGDKLKSLKDYLEKIKKSKEKAR